MRQAACIVMIVLLSFSSRVFAYSGSLSFKQSSSGAVSAVVAVPFSTCGGAIVPNISTAQVKVTGNQISIFSSFVRLDPSGPPPCTHSIIENSLPLGVIADGSYYVTWTLGNVINGQPVTEFTLATGQFALRSGLLQATLQPVPSFGEGPSAALLVLLLAVIGQRRFLRMTGGANYSLKRTAAGRLR